MPNRLAAEKSPYLLQHAHNPVDWHPWGDEAFEKAAREDKPVFLSIGYSTCHWCHVMERESFENEEIARLLNENFVSIKVDREERPDVDRIYMLFVQASTGGGGWPMSVFLTPDRKPFFGGTYFPPHSRHGRPGFAAILENLARAWRLDRARIQQSSAQAIEQLREYSALSAGAAYAAGRDVADSAFYAFRRSFDSRLGGFGGAPKFPRPSVCHFLLRYHAQTGNAEALEMVLLTLREMAKGGINDQLGGGFHRYSVDERWFVPHFEKMLYDQAQLAVSYLEAFQITREPQYAATARSVFDYVLRDLPDPAGGFYSAEDADSALDPSRPEERREGAFYLWNYRELVQALGASQAAAFCSFYGVEERGNVRDDPHGEFGTGNILHQARAAAPEEQDVLAAARQKLLRIRSTRPRPPLDDKILAGWNGLMISAFAKGAQILQDSRYEQAARRAIDFLGRTLWRESDSTLLRRYRQGEAAVEGFLDDYAFLALGLLDMYETSFDPADLAWAARLVNRAIELFEDDADGGFFSTMPGSDLVLRLKEDYDGAEPSGNSAISLALLRLARFTGREDFRAAAERALKAFGRRLAAAPTAAPMMLAASLLSSARPMEIVLAGPPADPEMQAMLKAIRGRFLPNAVIMRGEHSPVAMPAIEGHPTAYVCENYTCQLPVTTAEALNQILARYSIAA
ncbi:MAG TPA: thioredoxin domain-containing protein [Bryobacteraceae bacterium]|nr:thioredoxin domain-containing protein [Bryobacteraceae bacterium]